MKSVPATMPPARDDAGYTPETCIQVNAILATISSRWAIRHVTPGNPPRVDYALTDPGRGLLVPIDALAGWALDHRTAG